MFGERFELNGETLNVVEEIGRHMPGGFFIYKAEQPEELLYANHAVFDIFGCKDIDEFKELTGYTFKGMLHPDDYEAISESIVEQIDTNEDNMDYVEYRIIRKDGRVRWVDDYGHFTETKVYGGVYYVFISDITEKKERMETDKAVRQAVIEALSESYHTVWLINDVKTGNFSLYRGDIQGDTIHSQPIKNALGYLKYAQAKENYIRTTVAPKDRKRLEKELELENIARRLEEKPQFIVNYLRKTEGGSERYFRIEFAKVNMPEGNIGVVCGFKDVDDEIREEQAIQKALRDAKKAEEENRRLIEEVETAAKLANLMGSVASLLTNMPALSFSKDAETGKYLACNQSFAEYANKDTPADVIGLTDFELFDEKTAKHFVEDDKTAMSMEEPYIFFEDVPDAAGILRNLQTTKLKFTDSDGRLCTLGMCVDVTEMTRIKFAEAEARIKQQELEEKIALQEQLLREKKHKEQQDKMITSLASDYWSVYYIELDKDHGICYQPYKGLEGGFKEGEEFSYLQAFSNYADNYVVEQYREEFLQFIRPDKIREKLAAERVISYRYMIKRHGKETYEMLRFAGVRHPEDRDDNMVHAVSACFADADAETRKQLDQSQTLRNALEASEEASRAKTNFLSNMSHEIRTPITAILGMNELIRRESRNETVLGYSHNIEKAGTSLLGIISDILDFSKIEAGRMDLVDVDYDVQNLIGDLVNLTRFKAEEKGLLINIDTDPNLPSVLHGDELRIKQIITNLLSNAVKYTEKGSITLLCRVQEIEDDDVVLLVSVTDTGIGIREEESEKLFSAFDRLDVVRTRSIEGTGLGLAITSKMLDLMGSRLQFESVYGKGSRFFFSLRQRIADRTPIGIYDPYAAVKDSDVIESSTGFTAPSAHVLIVDDTPMNLQVIVGLLKRTDMQIDTAVNGEECITCFGQNTYDMIFLDYRMPGMDGIETLKKLHEQYPEKAAKTPIICLTASAVSGDRDKMLNAGFNDYLSKPVNIGEMEKMLQRYLPEDKVIISDAEDLPEEEELQRLPKEIFKIPQLVPKRGLEYCGDAEDYMAALEIYEASIDKKVSEIEKILDRGDLEAYVNLVHSLKSTSRAIGAESVAEIAFLLEQAGKNGDRDMIEQKTPELLALYKSLKEPLEEIVALFEE